MDTDPPVHAPWGLKLDEAATVKACAPFPAGAVVVKVHLVLAVLEVRVPLKDEGRPLMHLVLSAVSTVSVSAASALAYKVPPTLSVPVPPLKTAPLMLAAEAAEAFTDPIAMTPAARNATLRNAVEARVAPRVP